MVNYTPDVFSAIADPTRRAMLDAMRAGHWGMEPILAPDNHDNPDIGQLEQEIEQLDARLVEMGAAASDETRILQALQPGRFPRPWNRKTLLDPGANRDRRQVNRFSISSYSAGRSIKVMCMPCGTEIVTRIFSSGFCPWFETSTEYSPLRRVCSRQDDRFPNCPPPQLRARRRKETPRRRFRCSLLPRSPRFS